MRASLQRLAVLLAALLAAATLAALAPGASGQGFSPPPCPPGTPPLPQPTVTVEGSTATPARVVAGRPFEISYDAPLGVIVHDTLAHAPSTTFDGPADGPSASPTVPVPGPAGFTVRYYSAAARPGQECTQSFSFTVNVELGDLLPSGMGYAEGPTVKLIGRLPKLPRRGALVGAAPVTGLLGQCTPTTARLPVVVSSGPSATCGGSPRSARRSRP
jgi:hypothetical protein